MRGGRLDLSRRDAIRSDRWLRIYRRGARAPFIGAITPQGRPPARGCTAGTVLGGSCSAGSRCPGAADLARRCPGDVRRGAALELGSELRSVARAESLGSHTVHTLTKTGADHVRQHAEWVGDMRARAREQVRERARAGLMTDIDVEQADALLDHLVQAPGRPTHSHHREAPPSPI